MLYGSGHDTSTISKALRNTRKGSPPAWVRFEKGRCTVSETNMQATERSSVRTKNWRDTGCDGPHPLRLRGRAVRGCESRWVVLWAWWRVASKCGVTLEASDRFNSVHRPRRAVLAGSASACPSDSANPVWRPSWTGLDADLRWARCPLQATCCERALTSGGAIEMWPGIAGDVKGDG
jgi:hypothetical protein